jgi:phosphoglycolate phosphatase-like HAD superfamily hydrolase
MSYDRIGLQPNLTNVVHVVWDWNGTLVDDLPIVIESVNGALDAIGEAPIGEDEYRAFYTRPVGRFYERLLDRPITQGEWATLDRVFHESYSTALDRVPLASDAMAAMDDVAARGWSQSILSMWWEEDLVACVNRRGLSDRMGLVQGNRNDAGGEKAAHLRRHLEALAADAGTVVMIGDSLDDAAAAVAVGSHCVLYDGGSHHREELEQTGVPVTDSLVDAVAVAARMPT